MNEQLATKPKRIVVLVSGRGSNLQALLEAQLAGQFNGHIVAVISNRPAAPALSYAAGKGIAAESIDHKLFSSRELFDQALQETIEAKQPDLVILAGFMRILSAKFVKHFNGRLINIHPSLLPKHKGLNTHKAALEANDERHGCTVHFVNSNLDGGAIIAQAGLKISHNIFEKDKPEQLADEVLKLECKLLPLCIQWYCADRLTLNAKGSALFDDKALPYTGLNIEL